MYQTRPIDLQSYLLSIVTPCFNERATLRHLVERRVRRGTWEVLPPRAGR